VLIAGLLLAGALFAVLSRDATPPPLAAGQDAPGFALATVSGDRRFALEDLRGRVVLVNFWATWCKPCEDEMPSMERLYRQLAGRPFELLAVSVDDDPSLVAEFQERLGLSFPILLDADKDVAERYQAFRFPESVLIDPEGQIVGRFIGPREWDAPAYVEQIRTLVGQAEAAAGG